MKILKIIGIAAGVHAVALLLIFANPGCSVSSAAPNAEPAPISAAPTTDTTSAPAATITPPSEPATIRYSPTRPGTAVASALSNQPASDVVPATTYTVARGETLGTIAKKNGISKADLAAANNLRAGSALREGQKLIIPSKATHMAAAPAAEPAEAPEAEAKAAPGESTHHVVKPGETLGVIARHYGVKQGDIAVANNITDPKRIQPGQDLVIPARSSSAKGAKPAKPAAPAVPAADQDLDAGLKPSSGTDVPAIKIDAGGAQPAKIP